MVEARTPRMSGFCCSNTNSSSSAEGWRANTSSLSASRYSFLTWKRALMARGGELFGQDGVTEELQQQLAEESHVHHRAVVALHERSTASVYVASS